MTALARPCELAVAVATVGLDGAGAFAWPDAPVDGPTWSQLVGDVARNRLAGVLAHAVASGVLPVTECQGADVDRGVADAMAVAVRLDQLAIRVSEVLDAVGVAHLLLKGPANAHLDYEDASLRPYNDIDVLLDARHYDRGSQALLEAGLRRRSVELRSGWDASFGKGTTLQGEDGLEVDLHRMLVAGGFGFALRLPDLWDGPETIGLGGRRIAVLGRPQRFLHACYHAALGDEDPRLLTQRDVVELLVALTPAEVEVARRYARAWKAEAVVAHAVRRAQRDLRLTLDHPLARWAATHRARGRQARMLAAHTDAPSFGAQAIASVLMVPGIGAKVAYVCGLAFPDRSHLASRREGALHRWKRAWQLVQRRRKAHAR